MELTQRLECTQELSEINNDKIFPDQIGFLGICGNKHPLKKGPNKIGRDPDTCSVILDVNSISRQHAVINILNKNEFMLMDLDSANKTKLSGKTLMPYMPAPLKNGDMVQFGEVFGVFRLFEEENDLPMTQAINVPETPVQSRCISKLNVQVTTIPESPDFSDRDDSFIGASQQRQTKNMIKSPRNNFLKTCGKTIEIKPIGTNKIDNVYWTSSKKSESFTSQANVSNNLDDSSIPQNIHELETQLPYDDKDNSNGSIYNALTQVGEERSLAIHEMETQLPADLPEVCIIDDQQNIQFDFSISENKENENIIINSEKDLPSETKYLNTESINTEKKPNSLNSENSKEKLDVSNDIILFDEIDSPPLEDNLESQSIMAPDIITNNENALTCENNVKELEKEENYDQNINPKVKRRQSSDSTDCEDDIFIAMTQKLKTVTNDDDVTDCEDEPEPVAKSNEKEKPTDENLTDCEDEPEIVERLNKITENVKFEDMCTQVIEETPLNNEDNVESNAFKMPTVPDDLPTRIIEEDKTDSRLIADLQTQVIEVEEDSQKNVCFEESLTQNIYSEEIMDFKMPSPSRLRRKRKIVPNIEKQLSNIVQKSKINCGNEKKDSDNDEIYYAATQELCIDLCSQKELSPEALTQNIYSEDIMNFKMPGPSPLRRKRKIVPNIEKQLSNIVQESKNDSENEKKESDNDEIYYAATQEIFMDLCSQKELSPEIVKQPTITLNTNKRLSLKSPKESKIQHRVIHESDEDCDIEEKINSFVANLSKSQIMDVVGTEKNMAAFKQKSNDDSDLKVSLKTKENNNINKISLKKESHENENKTKKSLPNKSKVKNYSEQNLRISNKNVTNHKQKEKSSGDIRSYLNKNTEAELLPLRSSSRIRKPTSRLKDGDDDSQKLCNSLFKPIIIIDDDEIKKDIETVNTAQSKEEKKKTKTDSEKKRKKAGKEKVKDESTKEKITKSEHKPRRSRRTKEKDEVQKDNIEEEFDVNKNKGSVRRSRNSRSTSKKSEKDHKSSKSPSDDKQKSDKKNHTQSKEKEKKSPEKEIRRSKRHRTSKKSEESSSENKSHKISNGHEQSTVYNMSSESGIDSPRKLKRSGNFEYPSAKKTKTVTSLRSTPARKIKTHHVLFTAFPCEEVKNKLEKLGAIIVTEVSKCTVVLTMQIKRTFKLLCAVGLGRPVVGPAWVQACVDTNMIVDPWLYLIKDEVTEKRFQFNLERSLVGKRNFLSGYNISSTPNVMPKAEEMKLIVECSGGKWKDQGPLWICVSCAADKSLWPTLKKKGAIIVSTEFILGGVLKQKLDIDKNRLM